MKKLLFAVLVFVALVPVALGNSDDYSWTYQNTHLFTVYDFHLGLMENTEPWNISSTNFNLNSVTHPGVQNVNTQINYWDGSVASNGWATFYYTHSVGNSSVTKARWTDDSGVEVGNYGAGNSQSGRYGSTSAEWIVNLDNGMAPGYVANYNLQSGQSLSGAVTVSDVEYALSATRLSSTQIEYFTLGGLLTFTPLATSVTIPLGGNVNLPEIARDGTSQYLILRYYTAFTGDANYNRIYHASQGDVVPEPATLVLLLVGATVVAGWLKARRKV